MASAAVRSAAFQLEALIHRVAKGSDAQKMLPKPQKETVEAEFWKGAARLSDGEAWSCLRQLQLWMASFPAEDSSAILQFLVSLLKAFQGHYAPPTLIDIYKHMGAGDAEADDDDDVGGDNADVSGWLDKARDELSQETATDSVELFLFKSAALVLEQMDRCSGLDKLPKPVVGFFFRSLEHASTLSSQRCAAVCCSVLSVRASALSLLLEPARSRRRALAPRRAPAPAAHPSRHSTRSPTPAARSPLPSLSPPPLARPQRAHLNAMVAAYFEKQKETPEKKFRWLLYTQALQMLAFGVSSSAQAQVTVNFLEGMTRIMAKVDRGKLRYAICTALERVFASIMAAKDEEAALDWDGFQVKYPMLAKQYADAYTSIYNTTSKWSKKQKHQLPCWCLMLRMVCVGSTAFYTDRKREPLVPKLLEGAKKAEKRAECTKQLHEYLRCLPNSFVRTDMEAFTSDSKKIVELLFPKDRKKQKEAEADERPLVASIIIAMGRQHPHFAFTELVTLLAEERYSSQQKATLCRALGTLAREFPREVAGYNTALGPLCFGFMSDADEQLSSHAIRTFPYVTVPDGKQEKKIVEKVIWLIVNAESDVAATAFESLCTYLMQMPDTLLVPLVQIFLELLAQRSMAARGDSRRLTSCFEYLQRLLLRYLTHLHGSQRQCGLSATGWIGAREQAEGVALLWLAHTDVLVRKQALHLLRAFSDPTLAALEERRNPAIRGTRLVELLSDERLPEESAARWSPVLEALLERRVGGFAERRELRLAIDCAWVRLYRKFAATKDRLADLGREGLTLWTNFVRFLCCSLAWPQAAQWEEGSQQRVTPGALSKFWVELVATCWSDELRQAQEIRAMLLGYLVAVHPSCIEHAAGKVVELAQHRLGQAHAPAADTKGGRRGGGAPAQEQRAAPANAWCMSEECLALLSRWYDRVYAMGKEQASKDGEGGGGGGGGGGDPMGGGADSRGSMVQVTDVRGLPRSMMALLSQCVGTWVGSGEHGSGVSPSRLTLGFKTHAMTMARVYLDPATGFGDREHAPLRLLKWLGGWCPAPRRKYVEAAYVRVPQHVLGLMPKQEADEERAVERARERLEEAVVEALGALLTSGALEGAVDQQKQALSFLQMMALRGPHLRAPVERAMANLLRNFPQFCGPMVQLAIVEHAEERLDLTQPAAELFAAMTLYALVDNWTSNVSLWQERLNVPASRMLMVSLLHQCSADPVARKLALRLASALAAHPDDAARIDAGEATPIADFVHLHNCVASTARYSAALAARYSSQYTEPLLRELMGLARHLSDVHNESMLQLVMPWIEHFGAGFADADEEEWQRPWRATVSHLLQLSYQCHTRSNSSFLFFTLEACWKALLGDAPCDAEVRLTTRFLLKTHAQGAPRADGMSDEQHAASTGLVRHVCTRILLFVAAPARVELMAELLMEELPQDALGDAPPPPRAQQLFDWLQGRVAAERAMPDYASGTEAGALRSSAFLLCAELLQDHASMMEARLPQLLQLACVYFGPKAPDGQRLGGKMLATMLAVLTPLPEDERKRLATPPEDRAGRAALMTALLGGGARGGADPPGVAREKSGPPPVPPEAMVGVARADWAEASLAAGLATADTRVAQLGLVWYAELSGELGASYGATYRVVLALCGAAASGRAEMATALLRLLLEHASTRESLHYGVATLLGTLAIALLNSALRVTFGLAQQLLRSLLARQLQPDTLEVLTHAAAALAPPLSVLPAGAEFGGWRAAMVAGGLGAQLQLVTAASDGRAPPLDELLAGALRRGAPLGRLAVAGRAGVSADDTLVVGATNAWLVKELRGLYAPRLAQFDALWLSLAWALLLRACTAPRSPDGDAACEEVSRWLDEVAAASASDLEAASAKALMAAVMGLHSSAAAELQYAAQGISFIEDDAEEADWWLGPLAQFVAELRQGCANEGEERRVFAVLRGCTCAWLELASNEPDDPQRLALLCMLHALLLEFGGKGHWDAAPHADTAKLLSSWIFRIGESHASKLRDCMQALAADAPSDGGKPGGFAFVQTGAGQGQEMLADANANANAAAVGRFAPSPQLTLIPAAAWLEALLLELMRLRPPDETNPPKLPAPDPAEVPLPSAAGRPSLSPHALAVLRGEELPEEPSIMSSSRGSGPPTGLPPLPGTQVPPPPFGGGPPGMPPLPDELGGGGGGGPPGFALPPLPPSDSAGDFPDLPPLPGSGGGFGGDDGPPPVPDFGREDPTAFPSGRESFSEGAANLPPLPTSSSREGSTAFPSGRTSVEPSGRNFSRRSIESVPGMPPPPPGIRNSIESGLGGELVAPPSVPGQEFVPSIGRRGPPPQIPPPEDVYGQPPPPPDDDFPDLPPLPPLPNEESMDGPFPPLPPLPVGSGDDFNDGGMPAPPPDFSEPPPPSMGGARQRTASSQGRQFKPPLPPGPPPPGFKPPPPSGPPPLPAGGFPDDDGPPLPPLPPLPANDGHGDGPPPVPSARPAIPGLGAAMASPRRGSATPGRAGGAGAPPPSLSAGGGAKPPPMLSGLLARGAAQAGVGRGPGLPPPGQAIRDATAQAQVQAALGGPPPLPGSGSTTPRGLDGERKVSRGSLSIGQKMGEQI